MKKIFWTTVFWLALILLFRAYLKLFDANLANQVANIIANQSQTDEIKGMDKIDDEDENINQQLTQIQGKLENILQKLGVETQPVNNGSVISGSVTK